jgi:hypothetical protein
MPSHTLTRTLVAALAVSALGAPAALAQSADTLSWQARNAAATAASHRVPSNRVQDLRRLRAGNSIRTAPTTESQRTPGYTPGERRGRVPYYSRANRRSVPQEEYSSSYGTPPAAQQSARTVSTDDGAPWTMIALGLAGAGLLIAMLAVARRARLRTHIAA